MAKKKLKVDADKFLASPTMFGKQLVTKKPLYECTVSFTYEADNPVDAAKEFIANIQSNPDWFVNVRNTDTGEQCTVDTETDEVEHIRKF